LQGRVQQGPRSSEELSTAWTAENPLPTASMGLADAVCQAPPTGPGQWVYAVGRTNADVLAALAGYDTVQKSGLRSHQCRLPALGLPRPPALVGSMSWAGFNDSANVLTTHEVYEPANDAWSTAAPLPSARGIFAAVTGPDGLIYAIGGHDGNNPLANVDAYDPTADTWTANASMHSRRAWHAAVVGHDGLIYAIGGGTPAMLSSVETFNVTTNTWTTSSYPLPVATCGLAAAVDPNGFICVIGGDTAPTGGPAPNVYCYNPADPGWITQPPMSSARAALAATTGPDGLIYAIGGGDSTGSQGTVAAFTTDKCYPIEQKIAEVESSLTNAQGNLGDIPPQDRADAEKQIIALGLELKGLAAQLKTCRGG
jgi:Kelch motif